MKGFLGLLLGLAASAAAADTPAAPGLTYLYSLNCTLGQALPVGAGPHGTRTVIPITGGTFSGPRLSADTRYHLQTDDGAHIFIRTAGPAQEDGKIHLSIKFETGSEKYYWLNNIVAVGVLTTGNGYVAIDGWQLESPR
ncbi:hypothetical protein VTG60DRAFT_4065 [Thermothelomyces hinnuleus]